ncbi:MAG: hypothetical protein ACLFN0_10320 [Thermovirgaceae bacterium]
MKITKRVKLVAVLATVLVVAAAGGALAHTPIFSCFLNDDGTVMCEGGFSDGSSAAGVEVLVKDTDGKTLEEGEMDEFGTYVFEEPEVSYVVVMNAGPGHSVEVKSEEIQ